MDRAAFAVREACRRVTVIALLQRARAGELEIDDRVVAMQLSIVEREVLISTRYDDGDEEKLNLSRAHSAMVNMDEPLLSRLMKRFDVSEDQLYELTIFQARFGLIENRELFFEQYEWVRNMVSPERCS